MSESKQEEIIGTLWLIAGLLAFSGGHNLAGWILLGKSALDMICSLSLAIIETRKGH